MSDGWEYEMDWDFYPDGRGEHLLDKVSADIAAGQFGGVEEFCADGTFTRENITSFRTHHDAIVANGIGSAVIVFEKKRSGGALPT